MSKKDTVSLAADRIKFLKHKENSTFVDAKKIAAGFTTKKNPILTDMEKLQHLKSSLRGPTSMPLVL